MLNICCTVKLLRVPQKDYEIYIAAVRSPASCLLVSVQMGQSEIVKENQKEATLSHALTDVPVLNR